MTYASAFTYAGAFKSTGTGSKNAGISYIHIFIKVVPTQVKMPEQGLKRRDLSPHSKASGLKRREKKRRDRNFDPIPALFRAIPTVLKTLW